MPALKVIENRGTQAAATVRSLSGARPVRRSTLRRSGGHPVIALISRRILVAVPLLVIVSGLSFVLTSLTPGDAARTILGLNATPEGIAQLRSQLGLDRPLWDQYWQWLRHAVGGDLGISTSTSQPVRDAISQRLPVTVSLMGGALLVTLVVGVGIGIVSALRGGLLGRAVDALALLGFALPGFWVGAELISLFAVKAHWLPATGYVPFADSPSSWLRSLVLPVIALSLASIAAVARQTREAMLETMGMEYVRMARACGLPSWSLNFRHVLKNASLRIITVLGVQAVGMLAGTVFVESVFALPGLGSAVTSAALQHDLPMVQGIAVVFTILVVLINLAIDLLYAWLNPKVRIQ